MVVKVKVDDGLKSIKFCGFNWQKDVKKTFWVREQSLKFPLDPVWYQLKILKTFRNPALNFHLLFPSGHKYNFMGAAKINLTHKVDGKNTYKFMVL